MNRWYAAPWPGWTRPKQDYFTGLFCIFRGVRLASTRHHQQTDSRIDTAFCSAGLTPIIAWPVGGYQMTDDAMSRTTLPDREMTMFWSALPGCH